MLNQIKDDLYNLFIGLLIVAAGVLVLFTKPKCFIHSMKYYNEKFEEIKKIYTKSITAYAETGDIESAKEVWRNKIINM
jgi:hypothetical protein